ncbi:unnamed protein product [Vicia faba]|uniref:Uncharacterized protein n=1 Tax=Vicia faba TaxID=3906 RepID=A0AAV0ZIQ0_VICFA|nr:unnamed protein product [Vicia faba]
MLSASSERASERMSEQIRRGYIVLPHLQGDRRRTCGCRKALWTAANSFASVALSSHYDWMRGRGCLRNEDRISFFFCFRHSLFSCKQLKKKNKFAQVMPSRTNSGGGLWRPAGLDWCRFIVNQGYN